MDFVLVFPLILALLSTGQSYAEMTEQTSNSCYAICPAGYYKVGNCDHTAAMYRCEKCKNTTYTDRENHILKCERCSTCHRYEVEIKPCFFNSNVVCAPKDTRLCPLCTSTDRKDPGSPLGYQKKCQPCVSKKSTTTIPPSTNPPATTSTTIFMTSTATATSTGTSASNSSPNPVVNPVQQNQMPWLFILGIIVIFLVLFWLLLFTSCPSWSTNKDLEPPVEDPIFNEQRSHQENSSPTMLTFNISEETPMSPATLEHATHISPLLPDTEHKAARQVEQSEHWPAIVLYTIIKEVPLRRWKEFLRLLSVADQQLDRVELEAGLGLSSMERQYQMLRLWSQRSSASLTDVFSALHYMDLSGCAQLLQESLEKLQWRPEQKHGFTA